MLRNTLIYLVQHADGFLLAACIAQLICQAGHIQAIWYEVLAVFLVKVNVGTVGIPPDISIVEERQALIDINKALLPLSLWYRLCRLEWHQAKYSAFQLHEVVHVAVFIRLLQVREVKRTLPSLRCNGGNNIDLGQIALRVGALLVREGHMHIGRYLTCVETRRQSTQLTLSRSWYYDIARRHIVDRLF